jgi:uncharacterized membrane protein YidH (DUF202 family)
MSKPMEEKHHQPYDLAHINTILAFERTRAASERTLMSWMRTSLSLISFGFSIATFFRTLREAQGLPTMRFGSEPVILGLILVFLGISVLSFGVLQEYHFMRKSRELMQSIVPSGSWSVSLIFALFLLGIGLAVFIYLIYRALY